MKKLLSLFGAIAIVGSGVSSVSACSSSSKTKFDQYNYSTWGDKQKEVVSSDIIKTVTNQYLSDRLTNFTQFSEGIVEDALDLVNKAINFNNTTYTMFDNLKREINSNYNYETYTEAFKNGITFDVKSNNKNPYFKGEVKILVKSDIAKLFNFSAWGDKQKEIVSNQILEGIKKNKIKDFGGEKGGWFYKAQWVPDPTVNGDDIVTGALRDIIPTITLNTNTNYLMLDNKNRLITLNYNAETFTEAFKNGVIFDVKAIKLKNNETSFSGEVKILVKGDITSN